MLSILGMLRVVGMLHEVPQSRFMPPEIDTFANQYLLHIINIKYLQLSATTHIPANTADMLVHTTEECKPYNSHDLRRTPCTLKERTDLC